MIPGSPDGAQRNPGRGAFSVLQVYGEFTLAPARLFHRARFADPDTALPVGLRRRPGEVQLLCPGGGRQGPEGRLPLGGWARLNAIHAGRWEHWFPARSSCA